MVDLLWKLCGIFGPLVIIALSVVMILQGRRRNNASNSTQIVTVVDGGLEPNTIKVSVTVEANPHR